MKEKKGKKKEKKPPIHLYQLDPKNQYPRLSSIANIDWEELHRPSRKKRKS